MCTSGNHYTTVPWLNSCPNKHKVNMLRPRKRTAYIYSCNLLQFIKTINYHISKIVSDMRSERSIKLKSLFYYILFLSFFSLLASFLNKIWKTFFAKYRYIPWLQKCDISKELYYQHHSILWNYFRIYMSYIK